MDKEVKRAKFYYYKTPLVNNIFTVCTFIDNNDEIIARGISICSLLDTLAKKEGRKRSYSRAMKALYNEKDDFPINMDSGWNEYVTRKLKLKNDNDREYFNSEIKPILVEYALKFKKFMNDEGKIDKIVYKINKDYPIMITNQFFKFKSEFKPKQTLFIKER